MADTCGHTALPNQNALKERISLPWADSNRRPPQEWDALTILASRHPYRYHAQRISCAIMFNNVAYQAATDGRAFQLIPLILVSVVRSSTAGLLVTSATGTNSVPSSRPVSLQVVSAGIHRPRCQSWFVTNMSKNVFLSRCGRCGSRTHLNSLKAF